MNKKTWIYITTQKEGIHCYPAAKDIEEVNFLQHPHRHMFHFKVKIEVFHDDRDIEFILLKREVEHWLDSIYDIDYKSCEMMANDIYDYIYGIYPGRDMVVEVSEDGENGAIVEFYA